MSLRRYDLVKAYVLDDNEDTSTARKSRITPIHSQKNRLVYDVLSKVLCCETHSVRFQKSDKPKQVYEFFQTEIATMKKGDLMIIYYDGDAGYEGDDWSLRFAEFPRKDVNGIKLMKLVNDSDIDCLWILDCLIPTRYLNERKRTHANTEIIAAGQGLVSTRGVAKPGGEGDFTLNLVKCIEDYVDLIMGLPMYKVQTRALKSIPQIMAGDKRLTSNPIRIWTHRPSAENKKMVRRIMFSPMDIKLSNGEFRPHDKIIKFCKKEHTGDEDEEVSPETSQSDCRDEGITVGEAVAVGEGVTVGEGITAEEGATAEEVTMEENASKQDKDEEEDEGLGVPDEDENDRLQAAGKLRDNSMVMVDPALEFGQSATPSGGMIDDLLNGASSET